MHIVKKWSSLKERQKTSILLAVLVAFYLFTRLYNLLGLPIFNDEAIYIHWAEVFRQDPHHLFISLTDGKQPSFIWGTRVLMRIVSDPLLAGRLVSVIAGLVAMLGLYLLGKEIFKNKLYGWAASLLYVVYPYSLVYDRMALYDSMVAMFAIWALYLEILLVRRRKISIAIAAALVIGGGLLTKSSAIFFLYLLPLSLLIFDYKVKNVRKELLRWLCLALIVVVGSMAIASVMRLSHNYQIIAIKNNEFTLTFSQWLQNPLINFGTNFRLLANFIIGYSTIPLLVMAVAAFFVDRKFLPEKLLLLAWFSAPVLGLLFFAKLLYPRYILFAMMPLLLLVSYTSVKIILSQKKRLVGVVVVLLLLSLVFYKDFFIVTNFARAPIPARDRSAYIEGFYSGVGIKEAVNVLRNLSKDRPIYVATQGGFGIMPYGIQDYVYTNPNIQIQDYAGIAEQPHPIVMDVAKRMPTYYVLNSPCSLCQSTGVAPKTWPAKEIFRIKRIEPNSYLTIVQILPN